MPPTLPDHNPHASKPKDSSKRSSYVSTGQLERLCNKTLTPNFRPPRRLRVPAPPSLRASLLPPPCAELDERPRWRVRRFALWGDRVPAMRQAVLDPRKRVHLKRFQAFATPSAPTFMRGDRSVSGSLTKPAKPVSSDSADDKPPTSGNITPFPSPPPTPLPHFRAPRPPTTLAAPPTAPVSTVRPKPRVRSTHQTRKAERARAMQHRLILERQEERRWRIAMTVLMNDMLMFVKHNTTRHSEKGNKKRKPTWTDQPPPLEQIRRYVHFMKDVRASSKNVWKHLALFAQDMGLTEKDGLPVPVVGVAEAKAKVSQMQDKEDKKRQKKREAKAAREARVQTVHRVPAPTPVPVPAVIRAYTVYPTPVNPRPATLTPKPSTPKPAVSPRPASPAPSGSSSSHSDGDRLLTPPASHRAQPTARPFTSPKLDGSMPDDIARQLAEMLQAFQRLGGGASRSKQPPTTEGSIESVTRRPSPRASSADSDTVIPVRRQGWRLSVSTENTSSEADVRENDSREVMTWATGELNIDDDTAALWSGGGGASSRVETLP